MKRFQTLLITLGTALFFATLFYHRSWGLNMLLFQGVLLLVPVFTKQMIWKSKTQRALFFTALLMAAVAFYNHSTVAFFMSWVGLFLFGVALLDQRVYSMHLIFLSWLISFPYGIVRLFKKIRFALGQIGLPFNKVRRLTLYILPLGIILVFLSIYSNANPRFGTYTASFFDGIEQLMSTFFEHLNWTMTGLFLLGLIISGTYFMGYIPDSYINRDRFDSGVLLRKKRKPFFKIKTMGLKRERMAAIFTFSVLNIMLLLLLVTEMQEVWFGFVWEGEYLKEFVHEGMYQLIFSILISMALVLYFFRGNQNFLQGSKTLKILAYTWIGLNGLLVISVGIRDFYYIQYFALAYKRIGVIFFLLACMVGLWSIFVKVNQRKNALFLLRVNSFSAYFILCVMALFNWDVIIAKYNFKNFGNSMVELDYMSQLSNKAYPYLIQSEKELKGKQMKQQRMLDISSSSFERKYMDSETYADMLKNKINTFTYEWETKDWLEWNPAEAKAYAQLKAMEEQ
ncbi:MAG: hypothetical protein CL843_15835 [Crocinitomicaceae bacterium]|nr:hypothetical protein [Crocinitomicaceae bacterium]